MASLRLAALCGLALALAQPALAAGTGRQGFFELHNDTGRNTVVGFYTNDGSGWSDNWLDERLEPGGTVPVEFNDTSGPCEQTLRVGWLGTDGSEVLDDPFDIDICEASNVYLGDNEITFD
jgi:hypothetical protein